MPIVDVELVGDEDPESGLAQRLADVIGPLMEARPGSTWVRVRRLPRSYYGESGGPLDASIRPVFVTVLAGRDPDPAELGAEARLLAAAVAETTGHPETNVHVVYEPDARGRIAFGGRLVEPPNR